MDFTSQYSAKGARLLRRGAGNSEYLHSLGGLQRTKESTIGAAGDVVGGVGSVITGQGGRFRGILRAGEGVANVLDAVPSAATDGLRSLSGMPTGSESPARFNITRAINDAANIRTDDPLHTVTDTLSWTAGMAHAVLFRGGSDVLRLMRG